MVDEIVQDRVLIVSYDCIIPDIQYRLSVVVRERAFRYRQDSMKQRQTGTLHGSGVLE